MSPNVLYMYVSDQDSENLKSNIGVLENYGLVGITLGESLQRYLFGVHPL